MADTVAIKYVYPPNYDTTSPPSVGGSRRYVVNLTNMSDGTGESAVAKVDISTLRMPDNSTPTSVAVEKIEYQIAGFTSVLLYFDHTSDVLIAALPPGSGCLDWTKSGGMIDNGSGGAGDILLTTEGAAVEAAYTITLTVRPKA